MIEKDIWGWEKFPSLYMVTDIMGLGLHPGDSKNP
jgi:hypothetical protein